MSGYVPGILAIVTVLAFVAFLCTEQGSKWEMFFGLSWLIPGTLILITLPWYMISADKKIDSFDTDPPAATLTIYEDGGFSCADGTKGCLPGALCNEEE